ncbi:MAG: cysteine desulfurase [Firmicutes bacterium]|nr:cysteine desulfurase [Bacillota bacterium]
MIYFDNASTTNISEKVYSVVCDEMKNCFANPSSLHKLGFESERKITEAREKIASALKVNASEVYFTSGGTEANNTAILGAAESRKRYGKRVITMQTQHPSVEESFKILEERGFEVITLDVDKKGYVDIGQLEDALNDDTILVSIMSVNNEIGTMQKIEEIAAAVKRKDPKILFHTDNVQGFGKHRINAKNIDLMSISAHKIHALKGTGALIIKNGVRIESLIHGGEQQRGIRPGTENLHGIIAMGTASEECFANIEENALNVKGVKTKLLEIKDRLEGVSVNGDEEEGSPYILSLSFEGIRGEVLLHALENEDIFVSTGSACSSRNKKKKSVIDYLDSSKREGTVRFSFCADNTAQEAEKCVDVLERLVGELRKYQRR